MDALKWNCLVIVLTTFDNDRKEIYHGHGGLCLCLELRTWVISYDSVKFGIVWKTLDHYEWDQMLSFNSWFSIFTDNTEICVCPVSDLYFKLLLCICYAYGTGHVFFEDTSCDDKNALIDTHYTKIIHVGELST